MSEHQIPDDLTEQYELNKSWLTLLLRADSNQKAERIAALEQQLAEAHARLAGKWISVEERLPEIGVSVLFTTNESAIELGMRCFDDRTQIFQCERTGPRDEPITFRIKDGQVTFWQALPAPPAAKEEHAE